MKAAVLTGYDKNGHMLEIRDIPMPEMKDNDVLVKIRTAGVNPLDKSQTETAPARNGSGVLGRLER